MKSLTSLAAAAISVPLSIAAPVNAAAEYCHTNVDGVHVCIHAVYGSRSNRGITMSANGRISNYRVNCYNRDYGSTSLVAYACWSYNAIKADSEAPKPTQVSESVKSIMTGKGFISESDGIDLDKVMNAMPPEMQ